MNRRMKKGNMRAIRLRRDAPRRSWRGQMASLAIHAALLVAFGGSVAIRVARIDSPDEPIFEVVVTPPAPTFPDMPSDGDDDVFEPIIVERIDADVLIPEMADLLFPVPSVEPIPDMSRISKLNATLPSASLPPAYSSRTPQGRNAALEKQGGQGVGEAINQALRWLDINQNMDGSWGGGAAEEILNPNPWGDEEYVNLETINLGEGRKRDLRLPLTGLATLAFLANGETPATPKHGAAVGKALEFLSAAAIHGRGMDCGYTTGIVGYALAEAYAMTGNPSLRPALVAAISRIQRNITRSNSFGYYPGMGEKHGDNGFFYPGYDLSVAGFNYQALAAARLSGADIPGLEDTIARCVEGLLETHGIRHDPEQTGPFNYTTIPFMQQGFQVSMASVGALCLQLFGRGGDLHVGLAVRFLREFKGGMALDMERITGEEDFMEIQPRPYATILTSTKMFPRYMFYYQTQMLFNFHKGEGLEWGGWWRGFVKFTTSSQEANGSWGTPRGAPARRKRDFGHGESAPAFGGEHNLRVYATSMSVLALSVPFRYLPTYQIRPEPTRKSQAGGTELELLWSEF